ncbi:MAG: hypothetical protein JXQ66_07200 [Campylobacterales bacterium]|nr:hypothetical protein [Campylobacterales bacterium]
MNVSNNSLFTSSNSYIQSHKGSVVDEKETENVGSDVDKKSNPNELSQEEKLEVAKLQARDAEVKTHEAAHQAAGGGMTGGASFTYQQGSDGKMYAIGGEVSISMPNGSTPEEMIASAQQVIALALAPADPSSQDLSVAASARSIMMDAQNEKGKEDSTKNSETKENVENEDKDEYILDTFA